MNISPRFQRIAAFVREHGFAATAGVELRSGAEFVDIEIPYVQTIHNVFENGFHTVKGVATERAYSKADAARILGY